jgi:predicted lipoprotein with Yx(FWY)xxD motif
MLVTRSRTIAAFAALAATAVLAAACGSSYAGVQPSGTKAAQSTLAKKTLVKLRSTALGKVLVDARGRTLYLYTPDGHNKSACYGQCASYWPPLLTTGKPLAGAGVKAKLLGVTMRKDGKHQVTYAGHPLYFFVQDSKAGQTNGEEFQNIWYVVSAAGKKVEKEDASKTSTTQTTTTSSGYGSSGY